MPDVEGWRDFVHVETGQTHAAQLAKEIQQLARRQAACRGYPGSRGIRRVQGIDIERDMERVGADPRPDLVRQLGAGPAVRRRGGNQRHAHFSYELHFLPVVVPAPEQGYFARVDFP